MKSNALLITGLVLAASLSHAQWDRLPGDTVIQPAAGTKTDPAIAEGAGGYLMVWSDTRNNPFGSSEYETAQDIFGMRLSATGQPLDEAPFSIASEKGAQTRPKVTWNGTSWLVSYESTTLDGNGAYYTKSIAAKRVSGNGAVLDAQPIPLPGLDPTYGWVTASNGSHWMLVSQGGGFSTDIIGLRIGANGQVLDPPTRTLVPATYYWRSNLRLAYAGGTYLLTFDDRINSVDGTAALRFDSNLNVLSNGLELLLSSTLRGLTSNGTQFLYTWAHQRPDFYIEVRAKRVNPNGSQLDGAGLILTSPMYPGPNVAGAWWDGSNYRIGWIDFATPKLAKVSSSGVITNINGVAVTGAEFGACAGSGGTLEFAQAVLVGNDTDIRAQNISASNVVGPMVSVSLGQSRQIRPDVAAGATGFMTTFLSQTAGSGKIVVEPLDALGRATKAEPITLATGANLSSPRVAWNGSNYLVTWSNGTSIFGRRVSQSGSPIDAAAITIMSTTFGEADVAAVGGNYLVLGRRATQSGQVIYAVGARLNGTTGAVLDATPLNLGGGYLRTPPVVCAIGGRWLVAYISNWTHDNSGAGTAGVFVETSGVVGTSFTINNPFSTAGGNGIFEVALASNGTTALFAQPQELTSGVENDLLVHTISSTGVVGPTVNVTPWEGNQYRPNISWDGNHFVIAYQEQKTRFSAWTMDQIDARSDLYGMRVSATGQVIDPQGFALSTSAIAETDPNIASLGGLTVVAASRMAYTGLRVPVGQDVTTFAKVSPWTFSSPPMNYRIETTKLGGTRQWPVAIANAASIEGDVPLHAQFVSAGSFDPDGTVSSYKWSFGDGTSSSDASPNHTYTVPGEYTAILTVTDSQGLATRQAVKVVAQAPNLVPIANGTQSVLTGHAPLDVELNARGSFDPDGHLGNIDWMSDEGTQYYGETAYYTFYTPGTRTVTMTVHDSRGATSTKVFMITVLP